MINAGLDEAEAGIKIAGRNLNNVRYADDTTFMAESEEELKSLFLESERGEWKSWLKTQHLESKEELMRLLREKESEKVGLKLNIQKTKIMAPVPSLHGK